MPPRHPRPTPWHPYHRSPWVDVARVVALLAVLLGPLAYLAIDLTGSAGRGSGSSTGTAVVSSRGSSPGPSGARSLFASRDRSAGSERRSVSATHRSREPSPSYTPFSSSWREQATPSLSAPSSRGGGVSGSVVTNGPSGIASPGRALGGTDAGPFSSSESNDWRGAVRAFGRSARALSQGLARLDRARDPVQQSLGSEGAPAEGPDRASGSTSAATTNGNPPLPEEPVPVGDHLHWLLVVGLLWGVWRLHCR